MDRRIVHVDGADLWIVFIQRGDVRVEIPDFAGRGAHIGKKLARIAHVQAIDRRGQRQYVAGR